MANRTRQAHRPALYLSEHAGVDIDVSYLEADQWEVRWPGGPTTPQMRELVDRALDDDAYDGLRDRRLVFTRGEGDRAWAARAVAAYRDDSLQSEVARRVPLHRHGRTISTSMADWTPEDYAFMEVVEELVEATPFPDRPSQPGDVWLINRLLEVSGGHRREMGRLLFAYDPNDADGSLNAERATAPPVLRVVRDEDGGRRG